MKNMRKITKLRRSIKAISPVISVLLMIAIAVVASLVVYAWVMGYMGFQTSKTGQAVQVQSYAPEGANLAIYVQNVGKGAVTLEKDGGVYINDQIYSITSPSDLNIPEGQTTKLLVALPTDDQITVKVVTTGGTFSQTTGPLTGQVAVPTPTPNPTGGPTPIPTPIPTATPAPTPTPNPTTFALDGSASAGTSGTQTTLTLTLTTTSTNDIVYLSISEGTGVTVSSVISSGMTWTQRAIRTNNVRIETWYAVKAASGQTAITITWSSGTNGAAVAFGISGADNSSIFDGSAITSTGNGSPASASKTTTNTNDFIIGAVAIDNTPSVTVGSGYTIILTQASTTARETSTQYRIVSATGTYSPSYSNLSGNYWAMVVDAIKKAP
jgi:flagellin-like protein